LPAQGAEPPAGGLPGFDVLAARQVRLAPGMREMGRGETSASTPLPDSGRDTCVRVAFVAGRQVSAALVARDGAVLERSAATADGVIGSRGPVCFRAGAGVELRVEGDAGIVRFVVWGAP